VEDVMKTTKHCSGCRNNFYNGNNPLGVKVCWSLKDAKMVTRFRLDINTPMNIRSAYEKRQVPDCYSQQGYVHIKQIPDYAS